LSNFRIANKAPPPNRGRGSEGGGSESRGWWGENLTFLSQRHAEYFVIFVVNPSPPLRGPGAPRPPPESTPYPLVSDSAGAWGWRPGRVFEQFVGVSPHRCTTRNLGPRNPLAPPGGGRLNASASRCYHQRHDFVTAKTLHRRLITAFGSAPCTVGSLPGLWTGLQTAPGPGTRRTVPPWA